MTGFFPLPCRLTLLLSCLLPLLCACNDQNSDDPSLADEYGLQLAAYPGVNGMPSVTGLPVGGSSEVCPADKPNEYHVNFAVRANVGILPDSMSATGLKLAHAGVEPLALDIVQAETAVVTKYTTPTDWYSPVTSIDGQMPPGAKQERVLQGVAKACASNGRITANKLQVTLSLRSGAREADVSANDVELLVAQ